jgi:hypothetical protein
VLSFNEQFSRIMACIPETAPQGQDHLLQNSVDVKSIRYKVHAIAYETVAPAGEEVFVVHNRPSDVTADGKKLPKLDRLANEAEGWTYADNKLLRVRHGGATKVEIQFAVEAR